MRYCCHCGNVIDEFDSDRDYFNCTVCDAILLEDDMTALKYAELSEEEKDNYDNQLLHTIKNSIGFEERFYNKYCSMESGEFWRGFRPDKFLRLHTFKEEKYRQQYINFRKANEPFQPFPPMDKEKARQHTHYVVMERKQIEEKRVEQIKSNQVTCTYCKSTDVKKITNTSKTVHTALFGIWSMGRNDKNYHCNNCGSDF